MSELGLMFLVLGIFGLIAFVGLFAYIMYDMGRECERLEREFFEKVDEFLNRITKLPARKK